ncbi:MAG: NlpC/P60 family protein [Clostridiales bacterium]|nr:NlpC/P60 family protein [Clostridiales bacterium]
MSGSKDRTAARYRAAVFFLLFGMFFPMLLPHGALEIPEDIEKLLSETLPGESSPARLAVVRTACGTVGQVRYFWGGKSHASGWDPRWGWPKRVTAPGNPTTGQLHLSGLDCSGLVSWAFASALDDPSAYDGVGEGVRAQYAKSIPTADPRPGDLAFFPDLSHVGIIMGRDSGGRLWVVHCSQSRGGVVATPFDVGFGFCAVPTVYSEKSPL